MLQIPQNYIHTRSTPFWNKQTAPAGIFERHLDKGTRPGVYPRLSVMHGAVKYLGYADEHSAEPDQVILIEKRGSLRCSLQKSGTTLKP